MPASNQSPNQPSTTIEQPITSPYDLYRSIVWSILDQKYQLSHIDDERFELVQKAIDTAITVTLLATNIPNDWATFTAPVAARLDEMEAN